MREQDPVTPCLHDVLDKADGVPSGKVSAETTQYLADAVMHFEGITKGYFGCQREVCGKVAKVALYPGYHVMTWPQCRGNVQNAETTNATP